MAVIREELVLADRFSGTLNKYIEAVKGSEKCTRAVADAAKMAKIEASVLASAFRADAAQAKAAEASNRQLAAAFKSSAAASRAAAAAYSAAAAESRAKAASLNEAAAAARLEATEAKAAARSQDRMNWSMLGGGSAASSLMKRVMALAGAYVSLRTAQKFVEASDAYVQTTARLDRMNDGMQSTAELQNMVYQAAMRSRGAYQDMADMVGKLGTLAPDAFGSNQELVAFAEQVNKQFALAGTSAQGVQAAMLQLTQAMSSGVLRGEELNSILEQAPTIAQAIAKYMGVSVGEMRELASQGKVTANVVKAALFSAAEETNAAFEKVPMTFGQAWTMAKNAAMKAVEPAMQKLNDFLNSDLGQKMLSGLVTGLEMLGSAASWVIDLLVAGAQWVADNWDVVSVALQFAGSAFLALAAISVASAIASAVAWAVANWPLVLLTAIIFGVIQAMYQSGMTSEEVFAKIGAGAGWLFALGYNFVAAAWDLIATFAEFFANVFDNPIAAIANLFLGLFNFIMDIVSNAAGAIDALLGSNISGAVKGFQGKVNDFVHGVFGDNQVKIQRMEQISYQETMDRFAAKGASIGKALDNFSIDDFAGKFAGAGFDYSAMLGEIPSTLGGIKDDTGAIKRSVALSEEDMKMLVDMAERQYINNINLTAQTPVITVNGQNTGNTAQDEQWLAHTLKKMLIEQAASHTDLSYQ